MWTFSDIKFSFWQSRYFNSVVCPRGDYEGVGELSLLSPPEKKFFLEIARSLHSKSGKKIEVLFRGESQENIRRKLSVNDEKFYDLLDRLFLVGDKSKNYIEQKIVKMKQELSNSHELRIKSISDTGSDAFEFIFNKLSGIFLQERQQLIGNIKDLTGEVCQPEYDQEGTNKISLIKKLRWKVEQLEKIEEFSRNEASLCCFFRDIKNLDKFKSFDELTFQNKEEIKLKIRDYFLYLLHSFSSEFSFFVSTSKSFSIAEEFATSESGVKSFIIFYFLPSQMEDYAMSPKLGEELHEICEEIGFPIYRDVFYPREDEVAVKGGLVPHRIFGLFDIEKNQFIVNPHVFQMQNSPGLSPAILSEGLDIDQGKFRDIIKLTSYRGYNSFWKESKSYSDTYLE